MSPSERIKELNIDSTLSSTPARIINLLDFVIHQTRALKIL